MTISYQQAAFPLLVTFNLHWKMYTQLHTQWDNWFPPCRTHTTNLNYIPPWSNNAFNSSCRIIQPIKTRLEYSAVEALYWRVQYGMDAVPRRTQSFALSNADVRVASLQCDCVQIPGLRGLYHSVPPMYQIVKDTITSFAIWEVFQFILTTESWTARLNAHVRTSAFHSWKDWHVNLKKSNIRILIVIFSKMERSFWWMLLLLRFGAKGTLKASQQQDLLQLTERSRKFPNSSTRLGSMGYLL